MDEIDKEFVVDINRILDEMVEKLATSLPKIDYRNKRISEADWLAEVIRMFENSADLSKDARRCVKRMCSLREKIMENVGDDVGKA